MCSPLPYVIHFLLLWHDIAYLCWTCRKTPTNLLTFAAVFSVTDILHISTGVWETWSVNALPTVTDVRWLVLSCSSADLYCCLDTVRGPLVRRGLCDQMVISELQQNTGWLLIMLGGSIDLGTWFCWQWLLSVDCVVELCYQLAVVGQLVIFIIFCHIYSSSLWPAHFQLAVSWCHWVLVCWWWHFDWSFARLIAPVVTTHHLHHP